MRDLYRQHVDRLRTEIAAAAAASGYDAIVFHAGAEAPISRFDDQFWTFRPTPAYAHWTPIAEPGAAVVLADGKLGLHRPAHTSYWEARPPEPPQWALEPFDAIDEQTSQGARTAFVGERPQDAEAWGVGESDINPHELLLALDAIRAIKSEYEVECIAEANRIATTGHQAIATTFSGGDHSELALHLCYLAATGQDDVDTPYKGIVALGRNAAVLHHNRYGRLPEGDAGASMLVDAGAQVRGYAADVTRTYVKPTGEAAAKFAELIDAINTLQQTICSRAVPGVSFEVLHDQTHELLAEVVRDQGIATASAEELIESGVTRALLPHGLGHALGIQVHDVGCKVKPPAERNPFLRNTADVTVGHVFTVEPGCYFIDSLLDPIREASVAKSIDWALIDQLRPFGGIRIEDNLAITADETRNLTRDNWPSAP